MPSDLNLSPDTALRARRSGQTSLSCEREQQAIQGQAVESSELVGSSDASGTLMPAGRWAQLWLGVLCMMLIANLQYAWTLFVGPIKDAHGWSLADIQWAFAIFIATETWITPFAGYAVDHLGPRRGPGPG